jgi:PQQ-dependent dehydrogenase (methanol/ethanol family)
MRKITLLLLVLFVISTLTVLLSAQHGPGTKNPLEGKPEAIEAGKRIYDSMCAGCHGSKGDGGRGPAVNKGTFKRGNQDAQLFDVIKNGISGTAMPPMGLNDDETWQVVSFLRSMAGSTTEAVTGNVAAGEQVFKTNCAGCHMVNGQGSRYASDLSTIGNLSVSELKTRILKPGASEGYVPSFVEVKTKDGKTIRGLRRYEDTFSLALFSREEEFHLLRKKDLADIKYAEKSIMPANYGQRLSAEQMDNLLAYLKSLKTPDLSKAALMPMKGGLAYERIANSRQEPHNWFTYFGDYEGRHYSLLKQINLSNAAQLQTAWTFQPQGNGGLQASPLVVDGIMYTTAASNYAYALDAATGKPLWTYKYNPADPKYDVKGAANRGFAMLDGRLFMTTADAHVVALDAKTGRELWKVEMAKASEGYFASMAPLALKDKIITGIGGGEFGVRGFIDAYDPATGKRVWRFWTIPGPGEFGNDTWAGDSWKQGAGTTWTTGTYDPETDTLYWPVGNPGPDLNGDVRQGDNLFSCSVVALDAKTGKRKWHFQFTPHDLFDWDANETPMLVDMMWQGRMRKLMLHANRNAFFYVLDRTTGEFLFGTPFARQNWATGLDAKGRPIMSGKEPSAQGTLVYPNLAGATNWQSPSFDPATGYFIFTYKEQGNIYVKEAQKFEVGKSYWGGRFFPPGEKDWGGVMALDPTTGKKMWDFKLNAGGLGNGLIATAGGVTFATTYDGFMLALNSKTGKLLWRTQTGGDPHASPISYAVNGRQFVACSMGGILMSWALPEVEP